VKRGADPSHLLPPSPLKIPEEKGLGDEVTHNDNPVLCRISDLRDHLIFSYIVLWHVVMLDGMCYSIDIQVETYSGI